MLCRYFMPSVLQFNVGLTHNKSVLLAGAINCMFCVGAAIPSFLLDRMGRRGPMIYGATGLAVCMMLAAVLLSFQGNENADLAQATASASIAFFFAYMVIFAATIAVVPWAYVPEILPLHARAKGTAIGISSNWLWNFFVVMITPTIIDRLQWKAYLIFMATNLSFVPLVYFFYPETTNLTLEEVDYLFIEGGPSARIGSVSKHVLQPYGRRPSIQSQSGFEKTESDAWVQQVEQGSSKEA
jgi:MFS family permease